MPPRRRRNKGQPQKILYLLGPYVIGGIGAVVVERFKVHCESRWYYPYKLVQDNATLPAPEKLYEQRYCAGENHGFFALLATIWMGFAIIIYRLLRDEQTRRVKYIHMMMNLGTLGLFSLSMFSIVSAGNSMTYSYENFHGLGGQTSLYAIAAQFVVGVFFFVYIPNCELRVAIAPFHDMFGVWIYIICVATCLSGKMRARTDYLYGNTELFNAFALIGFPFILIIIISPYFEWDLVGGL